MSFIPCVLLYPIIVPILVILIRNTTLLSATECLNGLCNCVWKGGKFTADCAALDLIQLPSSNMLSQASANKKVSLATCFGIIMNIVYIYI